MKLLKWFRKKKPTEDAYAKMGRLGVSPAYMLMYQESVKKINNFQ